MSVVIRVEGVSKKYHLGKVGTKTLKGDLQRWWAKFRGQSDPFDKISSNGKNHADIFWALQDINFEVQQGEALGIIGKNGAGKSTLLKILSRVTAPTSGNVKIKGRIASLLEVGTGFNPELSGRENIFLNGAILGMSKAEVRNKFDEIVDFSGVEKFIDTPVKRYSSGMYVRLAFAVAAHLESEILILDEVLAVGDAEFQKKCLGKMDDVAHKQGRTVLFVSHSMASVQKLCNTGILLKQGKVMVSGKIQQVIDAYLESNDISQAVYEIPVPENSEAMPGYAYRLQIEDLEGNLMTEVPVGKPWQVRVFFRLNKKVPHFIIGLGMRNASEVGLRTAWSLPKDMEPGDYQATFREENIILATGKYNLLVGMSTFERSFHYIDNGIGIHISDINNLDKNSSIIKLTTGIFLNPMKVQVSSYDSVSHVDNFLSL